MDCLAALAMTTVAGWAKPLAPYPPSHALPGRNNSSFPIFLSVTDARRLEDGKRWQARQGQYSLRQRSRSGQTFRDKKNGCIKVVLKP
jgi:hypothetical protein